MCSSIRVKSLFVCLVGEKVRGEAGDSSERFRRLAMFCLCFLKLKSINFTEEKEKFKLGPLNFPFGW